MPDLSIVIVSYNTCALLKNTLKSIYENLPSSRSFLTVVVDNASTDGSNEMVEEYFPQVKLIKNKKNLGFGMANNRGIDASTGKYVLLQNSDTIVLPGLYDGAMSYFDSHPDIGILGPKALGPNNDIIQMSWGWSPTLLGEARQRRYSPEKVQSSRKIRRKVNMLQRKQRDVDLVMGASMFIRRAVIEEIGGFDENIVFYFEEPDFCLRAKRAGWRVVFSPEIKIIHLLGKSTEGKLTRASQIYRQSQVYYYKKHFSRTQAWLLKTYLTAKFTLYIKKVRTPEEIRYFNEIIEIVAGERFVDFNCSIRKCEEGLKQDPFSFP